MHGRQKTVGVRGKIHAGGDWLQVQHRVNERRVLVREPIMFLPRPGTGLNVVETRNLRAPAGLLGLKH